MFQLFLLLSSTVYRESVYVPALSRSCIGEEKTYSDCIIRFTEGYALKLRHWKIVVWDGNIFASFEYVAHLRLAAEIGLNIL
jgi:hypothetical protein